MDERDNERVDPPLIEAFVYSCVYGHIILSSAILTRCFCPACLGPVVDETPDDPRLLSIRQDWI